MGKEPEIKGILKHRFEKMEMEPDIDLWPAIDEKIHEKPMLWATWKPYAAIAACLAVLIAVWLFNRPKTSLQAPIAKNSQRMETPSTAENSYRQELAKLEGMRSSKPVKEAENKTPRKKERKMLAYAPGPRVGQSLTLPLVEEQIIASKNLKENKESAQEVRPNVKAIKASTMDKPELAKMVPIQQDLSKMELKPLEPSKKMAIRKVNNNKMEINLNNLTLKEAVVFAREKINKKTEEMDIPVKVEEKQTRFGKKKTYQVQLFNVSFTRTTYRSDKSIKQL